MAGMQRVVTMMHGAAGFLQIRNDWLRLTVLLLARLPRTRATFGGRIDDLFSGYLQRAGRHKPGTGSRWAVRRSSRSPRAAWPSSRATTPPIATPTTRLAGSRTAVTWDPRADAPEKPAYRVWIYHGTVCNSRTLVDSYPRPVTSSPWQGGSLERGQAYTAHLVAEDADGSHARPWTYASVEFSTA